MTQFVVECYDNDFSIISEYFYMSDIDLYYASDKYQLRYDASDIM